MGIYLDYNAGAPLRPEVQDALQVTLREQVGNASSVHWAGRGARAALEGARVEVGTLIGAQATDVTFTSGGTEANNLAIRGVAAARPGGHIVTTAVEHVSVLAACSALPGYEVTHVRVDHAGRVEATAILAALRPDTTLVSVGLANNEVGTIQPVADIAWELAARRILLHADAAQAAGKVPVAVDTLGVDLMSISAHKLGGPQGIGALYHRRGLRLLPQHVGGPQEGGRRAGTENVAAAVGFGVAARVARDRLELERDRQRELIARLWAGIERSMPNAQRNTPMEGALPNTLNVSFPGADADGLIIGLDLYGIAVSGGSACAAGALEPSHVLLAMGRSPALARSAVRISIGHATSGREIERFLAVLPAVLARSRRTLSAESG